MNPQRGIIDAVELFDAIIKSAREGSLIIRQSDVEEARRLIDHVISDEAAAFRAAARREASLHFGFSESIDATVVSALLIAERLALQDIAVLPAIITLANAHRIPKRELAESLVRVNIFVGNEVLREALRSGLVVYAPHRDVMGLVAEVSGDETAKNIVDTYKTVKPSFTLIQLRKLLGPSKYLVDALIYSNIAGVEGVSNDPFLRRLLYIEAGGGRLTSALREMAGGTAQPGAIIDLTRHVISKIRSEAERAAVLHTAQRLIVDPIPTVYNIIKKRKIGGCEGSLDQRECLEKVKKEAYINAFRRVVELREKGVLDVSELRNVLAHIKTPNDVEKAHKTIVKLLVDKPNLAKTVIEGATTLANTSRFVGELAAAIGGVLVVSGAANTNIALSSDPYRFLIEIVSLAVIAREAARAGGYLATLKRKLDALHEFISHKVRSRLGDPFSKAVIQSYLTAQNLLRT